MLLKRIIPCLLYHDGALCKTRKFKNPDYIGDPINAVKILNEKEVDELIFVDIDASVQSRGPDYDLIASFADECFMPLCYGGGIKTIEQMKKIFSLGVEKVVISSAAIENPSIIVEAAKLFGSQSIVVAIDFKSTRWNKNKVYTLNGTKQEKYDVFEFAKISVDHGAGELLINSIDDDGEMHGLPIEILAKIKDSVSCPVIALGGVGSLADIEDGFKISKVDAVSCGSLCVYQGPLRGILITYPKIN